MSLRIAEVVARQVWDSRARPTVEVEVILSDGRRGRGIAPSGASRGTREASELRDGGVTFGGLGVSRAIGNVRSTLAPLLRGRSIGDPRSLDALIRDCDPTDDKSKIGGNSATATSLALWQAAAAAAGAPLWAYLAGGAPVSLPMPQIQIFGGGAHAARRIDIQDLLVVPLSADSIARALEMVADVYRAAGLIMTGRGRAAGTAEEGGWWPAFDSNEDALATLTQAIERAGYRPLQDVGIALDVAASEFARDGGYVLGLDGRRLDRSTWLAQLDEWLVRFPIVSIEDPMGQDDETGWRLFGPGRCRDLQIVGDDFLVTSAARVRDAAAFAACNAVLIKVNQRGTVSEAYEAVQAARDVGFATIVSARSGETEDTAIAHLAVGWNAGQIKVGSMSRGERTAKWNELLRIEETLAAQSRFAGRVALNGARAGS